MPHHRSQHRHDTGNTVQQRQYLRPTAIVECVAQDGESHHVATARTYALNKTTYEEWRTAFGERT